MSDNTSKKTGKRYSLQFKRKIVEEIENGQKTFSESIREYGLNDSTLCGWLRIYRENGSEAFSKLNKNRRKSDKAYKKRGQIVLEQQKYLNQQEELRLLRMQNEYYQKVIELLTEDDSKKNPIIGKKPK